MARRRWAWGACILPHGGGWRRVAAAAGVAPGWLALVSPSSRGGCAILLLQEAKVKSSSSKDKPEKKDKESKGRTKPWARSPLLPVQLLLLQQLAR